MGNARVAMVSHLMDTVRSAVLPDLEIPVHDVPMSVDLGDVNTAIKDCGASGAASAARLTSLRVKAVRAAEGGTLTRHRHRTPTGKAATKIMVAGSGH